MANQVYFPHYKQIFDADPEAFILISHPETGLAYKIRVDALQEALASSLVSEDVPNGITIGTDGLLLLDPVSIISGDAANGLDIGSDDLLSVITLYSGNGTLTSDRTIDADQNDLTVNDAFNIDLNGSNHVVLQSTGPSGKGVVAALQTSAALQCTDGVDTSTIAATATSGISLTITSGNHINLAMPAGTDLQLAGSAGNGGEILQTNGALTPPIWKKVKYTHPFVIADWGAGTTLTIAAATHGLGASYHNVTVFDATHNIVPIAAVMTKVNVSSSSGNVVLTIVNNAAAFSGFAYITV
jgi:hypothetical protein